MARTTDTRVRVRELAEQFVARGQEPTPTAILRELGRGSASTVVDELRRWREEQGSVAARQNDPAAPASATDPSVEESPSQVLVAVAELLAPLQNAIETLAQRIEVQDKRHAAETAQAYDRFHAVQKMAMVAIDEAREQTRFWKQEAERAKLDAEVRADTYRDAMRASQAEAGRLAELLSRATQASTQELPLPSAPPDMTALSAHKTSILQPAKLPPVPPVKSGYDLDGFANE